MRLYQSKDQVHQITEFSTWGCEQSTTATPICSIRIITALVPRHLHRGNFQTSSRLWAALGKREVIDGAKKLVLRVIEIVYGIKS